MVVLVALPGPEPDRGRRTDGDARRHGALSAALRPSAAALGARSRCATHHIARHGMTRHDDFIGHLESYLDEFEGAPQCRARLRDAIRAELPSTPERRAWWPAWRYPHDEQHRQDGPRRRRRRRRHPSWASLLGAGVEASEASTDALRGHTDRLRPSPNARVISSRELRDRAPRSGAAHVRQFPQAGGHGIHLAILANAGKWIEDGQLVRMGPTFWLVEQVSVDPCHPTSGSSTLRLDRPADDLVVALTDMPGSRLPTSTDVPVDGISWYRISTDGPRIG